MKKSGLIMGALMLALGAFPSTAAALTCPAAFGTGVTRLYEANTATACAWNDGNLAQGGDAFLDGTADSTIGTVGTGWGNAEYTGAGGGPTSGNASQPASLTLSSTIVNGLGTWTITGAQANTQYAIGIVDGGDPKWAVFVVTGTSGSWGIFSQSGNPLTTQLNLGALSHIALYSRSTPGGTPEPNPPVPEPTTLLLLGSGLALAGRRFRNRRQAKVAA